MITRRTETYPAVVGVLAAISIPPRGRSWRLVAANWEMITSANVGNRFPQIAVVDGAGNALFAAIGQFCPASQTNRISAFVGAVDVTTAARSTTQMISMPEDLWIQPTWTVVIATVNGALAGDTIGPLSLVVDYPDPPKGLAKRERGQES